MYEHLEIIFSVFSAIAAAFVSFWRAAVKTTKAAAIQLAKDVEQDRNILQLKENAATLQAHVSTLESRLHESSSKLGELALKAEMDRSRANEDRKAIFDLVKSLGDAQQKMEVKIAEIHSRIMHGGPQGHRAS